MRRDRGAALLLVLAAVALLTLLAVELASRASADSLRVARAQRDSSYRRVFDSGSEIARGLLVEAPPPKFTTWSQSWNREIRYSLAPEEEGIVRLADESGKLNIGLATTNPGQRMAIQDRARRLFDYLSRHEVGHRRWKDLEAKVLRRIASLEPLLTLDGLRETGVEQSDVFESDGLSRFLTCFGNGQINLNTAPGPVLASLDPEFDDPMVERIVGYRGKSEGQPGSYKSFEEPEDLMLVEGIVNRSVGADGALRVERNLFEKVRASITVRSSAYSARVRGVRSGVAREAWSFFKPDGSRLAFEEILP